MIPKIRTNLMHAFPLALLIVLLYPVWSIMLRADLDLWATDDGEAHLLRIYAMRLALGETLAFPRWIPDLYRGYGYPVFNFYAPLTYVAGHLVTATGLSVWSAFRVLGLGAIVSGATGAYAFVRTVSSCVTGNRDHSAAIVAGLLYLVAPYPFVTNLYIRADLPEALGLGILPWFLLAMDRCLVAEGRGTTLQSVLIAAVLGAMLLLTHQLSGALALVSAILWTASRLGIWHQVLRRGIARLVIGGIVAGGLVAFSAIPTLTEGASVQLASVRIPVGDMTEKLAVPFGTVARPLISHPNANPGEAGAVDWAWAYRYPWGGGVESTFGPVKPAAVHAVIALVASVGLIAMACIRMLTRNGDRAVPTMGPVLILGTMWLFNTTWTEAIWANFAPMQFLQFPSRLYGPFSLGVALAVGMLLDLLAIQSVAWRRAGWIVAVATVVPLAYASLISPPVYTRTGTSHAVSADTLLRTEFNRDLWNGGTVTGNAEFTPVGVDISISVPGHPSGNQVFDREYPPGSWVGSTALVYAGSARISELRRDGLRMEAVVDVEGDGATVAFHQLSFPGWRGYVDGKEAPIRVPPYDPAEDARLGFQLVDVPAGRHAVTVIFGSTPPRMTGDAITAVTGVSILVVLLGYLRNRWRILAVWSRTGWIAATVVACGFAGMAIAQTAFEVVMSLPPRSVPGTTPNLIVANVADLVRSGHTRISSPTGADLGAHKFVDVRWLLVGPLVGSRPDVVEFPHGGRQRQWLFMHPPSRVAFDVTVPEAQTYFMAGMALRPEAWYTDYGDGVRFAVDVAVGGSTPAEVYAIRLNPRANEDERRWVEVRIPLAPYVGRPVEITLRTDPVDDVRNDWAGWGNPVVVVDRTLLRPVNGPVVPASAGTRPTFPR